MLSGDRESEGDDGREDGDGGLTAALEAGDLGRAMSLLVELHGAHVARYCRWMLGDDVEGEDVSQTVFVQAFSELARFAEARNVRAWLLGTARHRCLDRLRSQRRGPCLRDEAELRAMMERRAAAPVEGADPREHRALAACLGCLDARTKRLLVMRFHDELSYEEIGARLSDSPGALRVRMARGLVLLRRCLGQRGMPCRA
jgi:RNA polymerase sigma factor (sigma-70 family)